MQKIELPAVVFVGSAFAVVVVVGPVLEPDAVAFVLDDFGADDCTPDLPIILHTPKKEESKVKNRHTQTYTQSALVSSKDEIFYGSCFCAHCQFYQFFFY